MSTKAKGPLHQLQLDGDVLKKEVDEAEKQIKQFSEEQNNTESLNKIYQSCIDMKLRSSSMLMRGHELQQHNEATKVQNFDSKKDEEIKRIQQLQNRLNLMMDQIEASSSQVEHLRSLRHSQEPSVSQLQENENENQGEDEEEEDEYSEEEGEDEGEDEEDQYEVIHQFDGEQEGDLTVKQEEVVTVIFRQDDGWWKVKNEQGQVGMVPSNFLQEIEYEDDDDDEEEEEEETTLKEDTGATSLPGGDSGPRSGKSLWKGIKDAVNEPVKTDVTDVLAALGAIPAGFRPSTLGRFVAQEEYTLKNAVLPEFTESNTGLKDLQWDPAVNQIRALPTRVTRSCRLWSCRMIPLAGSGVEVLSRHIRLCLFNGTNVLSNVHTVRANTTVNSPKLWTFSPRVTGILPSLVDGACTVRSDITHSNLGILFELGITYIRTPPRKIVHYSDGPSAKYSDSEEEGAREKLAVCM